VSSSGKSTLCKLSNGLIPHAIHGTLEGDIELFGNNIRDHSVAELSTLAGIVFQEPESQLFCMSAEEEVAFGPENLAVPRAEIEERVEWALNLVGLKGYNDRSPASLSGGQKQRLAIAAALSMRPEMLVLDEPAYALDPVGRLELYSMLRDLRTRYGMTVVLAERDAEDAATFSDKVVLMKEGSVVAQGLTREVLSDPDLLKSVGVAPPQILEIASILNKRGLGRDFSFLTVDEAERDIAPMLSSGRRVAGG
jgi:energy-coupling factor transporter ATP-binding protein EcfA2